MIVSLVVAIDENNGIGIEGRLPWKISSDMRRFKRLTMGHHIIMGRKTWQSIGRVLPGRTNVILSHKLDHALENVIIKNSLQAALEFAEQSGETEVFVIGGGRVFAQALPIADRIYLSKVHAKLAADVFFPYIDSEVWKVVEIQEFPASAEDQYAHTYMILERRYEQSIF